MLGNPEGGFAFLFLLLGLPVAFAFLSWLILQFSILQTLRQERALCRDTLRGAQIKAGEEIRALLTLNSNMASIQLQSQKAQAALAAALASAQPPMIAAARTWLKALERARQALVLQQRSHLFRARALLSQALAEVPHKISLLRLRPLGPLEVSRDSWSPSPARLAVIKRPGPTRFPQYQLKNPIERRQSLEVLWQTQFQPRKAWPAQLPFFRISRTSGCGVTLIEGAKGFEPRPSPVRFSPKH